MCVICSCLVLLPFLELKWGVPGFSLIPQFHIFGVYLCFLFFFLQKKNSISVLLLVFTISTVSSFLWFFFVFVWSVTPLLLGTTLQLYVLLAASHTFRDLR